MSSSPQVQQQSQYRSSNNGNFITTVGSGNMLLGTASSSVQYSYSFATQTSESGAAPAAGGGGAAGAASSSSFGTHSRPAAKAKRHYGHHHHHHYGHGHSNRLASPVVSACRHLLQPNGSILGSAVADAVLPNFPDLCSALPADSFGHHVAFWGVDGRRPLTHTRLRQFILQEFGPTLHEYGFGRGQRIALVLPNGPELAMAILATVQWASCVPLKGDGQLAELKKDLQAARVDMILGEAHGDNTAALQDMARALSIPFYGMTPSQHEVGLFTFAPMSLPKYNGKSAGGTTMVRNIDRVNMQSSLYEHVMMISNADSDGVSCCGTIPGRGGSEMASMVGQYQHHHQPGSSGYGGHLETQSTYNFLSNDHDDEVLVLFTSGTTGNKKLVPHLLGDMMIAAACIAVSWNLIPDDVNCNLMPLFHVGGICRQVFAPILSAGSVICCPSFDPHLFWQLLLSEHPSQQQLQPLQLQLTERESDNGSTSSIQQQQQLPTLPRTFSWYYAAPTMHSVILATFHSTPEFIERRPIGTFSVRMIANAAGGLLPSLAQKLRATFGGPAGNECNVLPSYGMTECMPISSPPYTYQLEKPGTSGVTVGPEIRIFNGQLEECKPGKEGSICVRGRPCFRGYGVTASSGSNTSGPSHGGKTTSDHLEANKASFISGGWFNTGDLGYVDEDGYLYITGRSKEVINRGGEIISPLEVEEEIVQHPSIAACAAFSAPHQVLQEVVGVVLVHRPGVCKVDLPSLHQFLQDRLTPAKWPQCLVYMDALPKSHTNKLLRVKLGQRLNLPELSDTMFPIERTFEATCPPQGTPVGVSIPSEAVTIDHEYIQEILRQELGVIGSSMDEEQLSSTCMFSDPTVRTSTTRLDQSQINETESQLLVTAHPSRVGSLTVHIHKLDPKEVIEAAQRLFDGYMQPSHVCCYTTRINFANIKRYPEHTDAVQAHLSGENTHAQLVTDPMVRQIQELVQQIVDLDCLPAPDSSFFHVGGSSLLASQLASRIRKCYQVEFSGADVFRHNTCIAIAKRIQEQRPEYSSDENSEKSVSSESNQIGSGGHGSDSKQSGKSRFPTVDLQKVPFDMMRLQPHNNCLTAMIQLLPMLGFFPLYQFSRFFLFFMSILGVLHKIPGKANILKFIVTLVVFHFLWTLITPLIFIVIKWAIIGRYRAGRYPIWGSYYLRWWIVDVIRKIIGKGVWGSHNELLVMYYRMLGAKIGKNAKISLEAEIAEFDLVEIAEGSLIEYSTVRGFGVDNGAIIMGAVRVGARSSVGVRAVVAPHTSVPDDSHVGPATSSYEITPNDDNLPQHASYNRKATLPEPAWYMQLLITSPIMFVVDSFSHIPAMTILYLLVTMHIRRKGDNAFHTVGDLMEWLCEPKRIPYYIGIRVARSILAPFFYMTAAILVKWIIIGKFREGPRDISNQWTRTRHWLASRLFCRENMQQVTDLLGRHYESVSILYRLLGAKVGKRVFWPGQQFVFSGEFDLLEIGDDVVFGSRSVVLCSTVDRSCKVVFCAGSNISDNTVVLPGAVVGKNAVLASNTVCPAGRYLPESSIHLGSRGGEPILLEAGTEANVKEIMLSSDLDRDQLPMIGDASTLRPFGKAVYTSGGATYFVWPISFMIAYRAACNILFETIHALPLLASLHISGGILYGFPVSNRDYDSYNYEAYTVYTTMFIVFLGTHAFRVGLCFAIEIAAKWILMGKRMEGRYNWDTSTYGQRWELYQILTNIRKLHRVTTLDFLAGTPFMSAYFRALGSEVGRDCCLYPAGGDPYMPEPDLASFGDRCVVDVASVVCHLNTRGNFELVKIRCDDHVTLRTRSRIQQGVHVEAGGMLLEKTLALTGEVIDSDSIWQGAPARIVHTYPRGVGISPSTSFGQKDGGYHGMMMEMI